MAIDYRLVLQVLVLLIAVIASTLSVVDASIWLLSATGTTSVLPLRSQWVEICGCLVDKVPYLFHFLILEAWYFAGAKWSIELVVIHVGSAADLATHEGEDLVGPGVLDVVTLCHDEVLVVDEQDGNDLCKV